MKTIVSIPPRQCADAVYHDPGVVIAFCSLMQCTLNVWSAQGDIHRDIHHWQSTAPGDISCARDEHSHYRMAHFGGARPPSREEAGSCRASNRRTGALDHTQETTSLARLHTCNGTVKQVDMPAGTS